MSTPNYLNGQEPVVEAPHDCGMCDGPLVFDGWQMGYATFKCSTCLYWHISKDCCDLQIKVTP